LAPWGLLSIFSLLNNQSIKVMNIKSLKSNQSIYGNKGNVWNNTAHIYESGVGTLCNTPALASNWAKIEGVEVIGCARCLEAFKKASLEEAA